MEQPKTVTTEVIMKGSVTDGQLGQLAVKQHELFERVKRGDYASFEAVLDALQLVIEGKEPSIPVLAVVEKLTKWRSFTIGGVSASALFARVKEGFGVGGWAADLMHRPAFITQDTEEVIDTIVLTPADFGYVRMPTTTKLLDPTRLAEWSRQNAGRLDSRVVELLPGEAGPHIRDQYKDQPNGEVLWMAMERITGADGRPGVFGVIRYDDGGQRLSSGWARPGDHWLLERRVVYRLRKVVTQD